MRAVAFLIDFVVQAVLFIGALILVLNTLEVADGALVSALLILFVVLVLVGYPLLFESLTRGKSLGKLALGLRVVSDDGGPERFRQAVFRALAGFIEIYMFSAGPAVISSLASSKGKRLGDIFAGTVVITERAPKSFAPPPPMPPGLGPWAATLELSQLPDDLVATARQYLSRWYQLTPATQHEMGMRIAAAVSAVVAPPPPPGVPPHTYLAAVLAERRRREEFRLAAAQSRLDPGQHAPGQVNPSPFGPGPVNPSPFGPGPVSPSPFGPGPVSPSPFGPGPFSPSPFGPGPVSPSPVTAGPAAAPPPPTPYVPAEEPPPATSPGGFVPPS
ncbi:RDD family protein [Streptosporangiaceae bacterium NEAU-GS5]|nr:RDD family protein [Streptosporangiaceae bacterium NEAU-GS5]